MIQPLLPFTRCQLLIKKHLLFFLLLTIACPPLVWADYDVMLDASGSMRGFKKERVTWEKLLSNLESSARRKYQFGDRNNFKRVKADLINVRLRDQETYLGQALEDWLKESNKGDVVIIITDNIADTADTGNDSSQSQQLFYDLLNKSDSPFSHIAIFPLKILFKGKVFPIKLGGGNFYKGSRALSIYAIARHPFSDEAFDKLRRQIENKIGDFESQTIQIKPFDSKTVSGLVGDINIEPGSTGADVSFKTDDDGTKRLVVSGLQLGNEIKFSFKVNIESKSSFELENVDLSANIQLFSDEEMRNHFTMANHFTADVSPRRATISPDGLQDIRISFHNEPFSFSKLSFFDKLAYSWQNTMTIHGNLDLQFKANRENMKLAQGIVSDWSYEGTAKNLDKPKTEVQQKVYKLGDLVKSMLPEEAAIQKLHSVPVTLELRYPLWPVLVVILFFIFVPFLVWLLLAFRQSKEWILEDEMGHQTEGVTIGFWPSYQHYSEDGNLMFSLTSMGLGFWVNTQFSLHSSRFIGGGQNIRLSDPETDEEYSWQLREAVIKTERSDDEEDLDWV